MSKLELNVNAVETMYEDFFEELYRKHIEPTRDDLAKLYRIDGVDQMEEAKKILHDSYVRLEYAWTLMGSLQEIDRMINKKEEETETREI